MGGLSGNCDKNWSTFILKDEKQDINDTWAGSMFHNFAPKKAKELSYSVCTLLFAFSRGRIKQ